MSTKDTHVDEQIPKQKNPQGVSKTAVCGLRFATTASALVTALFIAGYSITDGVVARINGTASSYAVWLFLLDGAVMLTRLPIMRRRGTWEPVLHYWRFGLLGGGMSFSAYWIISGP